MLERAKRPLFIFGWGIHLAGAEKEAIAIAEKTGIPVCLTWGAADLMPHDHPLRVGTFGTHGNRFANFAIQNADYIICVGSRLDTKATGAPASSFAPKAEILMIDIDQTEIDKFEKLGRKVRGVAYDAKAYLTQSLKDFDYVKFPDYSPWLKKIAEWREKYPVIRPEWRHELGINPYVFVERLSEHLKPDDVIVSDTGCSLAWMMQAFKFNGQRFIHAFNNTPMGYGLPGAVGAAFATGKRVVLVTGDGGLGVNIGELGTIARHSLPIKILLFNNRGHAMCRQTQRQWLGGEYPSTSYEGGLACPDFTDIGRAYHIASMDCDTWNDIDHGFRLLNRNDGPLLMNLRIEPDQGIEGQVRFGKSLEDADPALPREDLAQIMEAA